jgi:outer membrane protein assembly factor BamA
VRADYIYGRGHNKLAFSFLAGRISGNAPLFEKFSLGDTATLRGWNKFDVAPAGGNRMVYASVQYGFGKSNVGDFDLNLNRRKAIGSIPLGFHVFYDVGTVGNAGSPMSARHSAGIGFGGKTFFMELGVPIRSSRFEPIFSMGFRF